MVNASSTGKLALLVGGGPAPGINGVISSATIEAIDHHGLEVIGFQDGFKWLVRGDLEHYRPLSIDMVKAIHLRGGSILGTSRTNPAKSESDMKHVLDALHRGVRAHRMTTRRQAMQRRGMSADWSWAAPARQHIDLYEGLIGGSARWTP